MSKKILIILTFLKKLSSVFKFNNSKATLVNTFFTKYNQDQTVRNPIDLCILNMTI